MSNPFNFNDPTPTDKFLGRWDTVNGIVKDLCAAQNNSHAIIGGRRCGKTSLLHMLQDSLLRHLATTERGEWHVLPVLLDVLGLKNESPFRVYKGLVRELYLLIFKDEAAFGDDPVLPLDLDTTLIGKHYSEHSPTSGLDEFKQMLGHIVSKAKDKYGPLRFVFLFDEVEEISEKDWTNELFGNLRSLTTDHRTSPHIGLVMAGSQRFLRAQRRPGSPLLNMFNQHHLEAFSDDTVRELIAWSGGFSDAVIQEVIALSGGHPYIAQFLMHHLWDKRKVVTVDDVQAVGQILCTQYFHILKGWCDAVGYSGQQVYKALAKASDWVTPKTVRQIITDSNVELDEGLTALQYHNLIVQCNKTYRYKCGSELFREWYLAGKRGGRQRILDLPTQTQARAKRLFPEVGRLAISELGQRWTLIWQSAGRTNVVDFSLPEDKDEQQVEVLFQGMVTKHGAVEVERVLGLVEQKRDLVFEWQGSKMENEKAFNREELSRAALRLKQEELDQNISRSLAEIEIRLKGLGIEVRKDEMADFNKSKERCGKG